MPRMGFTDMVKFSLTKAWENIVTFIMASAYTILIPTALLALVLGLVGATGAQVDPSEFREFPIWVLPVLGVLYIAILVMSLLYSAANIYIARSVIMSEKLEVMDALKMARDKLLPIFLTSILLGIALFALALLLIIPAIIFGILWMFAMQAVVLDNKQMMDALNHSFAMVKDRFVKAAGYVIVFGIILGILGMIVQIPVGILNLILTGIFSVAGTFGIAIAAALVAVLAGVINAFFVGAGMIFQTHLYMQWNSEGGVMPAAEPKMAMAEEKASAEEVEMMDDESGESEE